MGWRAAMNIESLEGFMGHVQRPGSLAHHRGRLVAIGSKGLVITGLSNVSSLECFVSINGSSGTCLAEIVLIDQEKIVAKPVKSHGDIHLGDSVRILDGAGACPTEHWKGRIISGLAEPLDRKGPLPKGANAIALHAAPPPAVERQAITRGLKTGIRAIDIFTPLCVGQRMGIFAGSGVGKSTLMGMLARASEFDCVIVALVGERGREVTDFVHHVLGPALDKSIVVVATGDESASLRKRAALLATALAEWFRDQGQNVLLLMDSVTRYAQALRELALAGGEPPVSRGFPPSVFSDLPKLLERSGPGIHNGSITGIYAVLVDGDNHNEPVADAIRGTLDGHIVLSRHIAASGRYPALDIGESLSRLIDRALNADELKIANEMRHLVGRYEESRDLRSLGGYQSGKDQELDRAVAFVPKLYKALTQLRLDGSPGEAFATVAELTRS
jgi:flagellum-specific ATP synthase